MPTKVINDAAMQALGSYEGGAMLFLGLGTGLGSALIVDGIVEPMEIGHLPFKKRTYEDYVGERGRERLGKKRWQKVVGEAVESLDRGPRAGLRRARRRQRTPARRAAAERPARQQQQRVHRRFPKLGSRRAGAAAAPAGSSGSAAATCRSLESARRPGRFADHELAADQVLVRRRLAAREPLDQQLGDGIRYLARRCLGSATCGGLIASGAGRSHLATRRKSNGHPERRTSGPPDAEADAAGARPARHDERHRRGGRRLAEHRLADPQRHAALDPGVGQDA